MDKQAIRDRFVHSAYEVQDEHGKTWWGMPDESLGIVAEEIAATHEQEMMAQQEKWLEDKVVSLRVTPGEQEQRTVAEKELQQIILDCCSDYQPLWTMKPVPMWYQRTAHAIAERYERLEAENTRLRAQVAVMKPLLGRAHGTLQVYAEGFQMRNPDHVPTLLDEMYAALSAAPEVAYSGIGTVDTLITPKGTTLIRLDCGVDALLLGRRYKVLVLAHDQGQECSGAREQGQKSKQEAYDGTG